MLHVLRCWRLVRRRDCCKRTKWEGLALFISGKVWVGRDLCRHPTPNQCLAWQVSRQATHHHQMKRGKVNNDPNPKYTTLNHCTHTQQWTWALNMAKGLEICFTVICLSTDSLEVFKPLFLQAGIFTVRLCGRFTHPVSTGAFFQCCDDHNVTLLVIAKLVLWEP